MSTTLQNLRDQARQLADMESNEFVKDSELNTYINFAIAELHDVLIESYGSDYFLESSTFSTQNGTQDYALPTNFYKLRGLDLKINNSDWVNVRPFNFNERNRVEDFGNLSLAGLTNIRYRVMGSNLKLTPTPDSNVTCRIWYIPTAVKLVNDSDTLNDINQYSDFVVVTAAMKMKAKEESDVSLLANERERIRQRIQVSSQNRDAAQPESITDIMNDNSDYRWFTTRT